MRKFIPILVIAAVILAFCTTASYAGGVIPACSGEAIVVGQTNYCLCASECCPVDGSVCDISVPGLQQCLDVGDIHYCNSAHESFCLIVIPDQNRQCNPSIDIEKSTNGEDADEAPGPILLVGDPVTWTYTVTNTGDVILSDVQVVDDQQGLICEPPLINPGETIVCSLTALASEGQYTNVGIVTATAGSVVVTDYDSSHYFGFKYLIGWANLQWPPTITHTISSVNRTTNAYGQVWIDGVTSQPGQTSGLMAQLGFGPVGSNPESNSSWVWIDAGFNVDAGNNDEFVASMLPDTVGQFDYLYRYSTTNGLTWLYADLNGPVTGGALPSNPGKLTVNSSGDTTPPASPNNLVVVSVLQNSIELAWDAVVGDPTLYGYEVLRNTATGGPYTVVALVSGTTDFIDTSVQTGTTYFYVVRAVDLSFNRSVNSNEVEATPQLRTVTVTFNVTVPATTDATGRSVYIAGSLHMLNGGLPAWNPGGVVLTRLDATHWSITLTGNEGTSIEYKYTLGDWDHVEKGGSCEEIANRQLTLSYGINGTQAVNDVVLNWRNVAPCGS